MGIIVPKSMIQREIMHMRVHSKDSVNMSNYFYFILQIMEVKS